MLSFPAWCFLILVGFLLLCAALWIFLQWRERERGSLPNYGSTADHIKRLRQ
jgi:hypothetical protein